MKLRKVSNGTIFPGNSDSRCDQTDHIASPRGRENVSASPTSRRAELVPGCQFGHYRILSCLGAGGMGEVYRASDARLGRNVAIKVLRARDDSGRDSRKRLEEEARATSALSHPNIVSVYEVGEAVSIPYVAFELVDGETIREALAPGPFPTKKLLPIARQMADGLAAAHDAGVVHRDLTPANVMISKTGLVKILDFGLANSPAPPTEGCRSSVLTLAPSAGRTGETAGTPGYMSPEQVRGERLDFRSDQFSFGAVLYEMAAGRPAFWRSTTIDTLCAVLNDEPEPLSHIAPGIPVALVRIVDRCLAKTPARRYDSTKDLARDLSDASGHVADVDPVRELSADRRPLTPVLIAILAASVSWLLLGDLRQRARGIRPTHR